MTRKLLFAAMIAGGAAGAAQAQTLVDTDMPIVAPPVGIYEEVSFSVSAESVLYESASWELPTALDAADFVLDDISTGTSRRSFMSGDSAATHFNIAAGNYTLYYRLGGVGDANVDVNVVSPKTVAAPEIDPSSAMAGLTLLGFGVTMLRSRRLPRREP
jgi:hypothetical protein